MSKLKEDSSAILPEEMPKQFVAFMDVLGFTNLVNSKKVDDLNIYFTTIISVLENMQSEEKKVQSLAISDSIILITPDGSKGLSQIIQAVKKIQLELVKKKVLLRGAISYGEVFFDENKNIIVGTGYIRAYTLEKEAIYPRVIIDPYILKVLGEDRTDFLKRSNTNMEQNLIYAYKSSSTIPNDAIFVDYANILLERGKINELPRVIYEIIRKNLYSNHALFAKYIWLRDYFLGCLENVNLNSLHANTKKAINEWSIKYQRL